VSIEVLANSAENARARAEMRSQGLDFVTPWLLRTFRRARLTKGISIGDSTKSWDLLKTIQFLEKRVSKASAILDMGAMSSEILCALHELGYSNLAGVDLNPRLALMPHPRTIKYVVGDFTETSFPAETFEAITAISVLEHGFCGPRIFNEISRILKPNGYFIGSVDYWPEKIDTSGIKVFGVDWKIFSEDELLSLTEEAGRHGIAPVGQLNFEASERHVSLYGRNYTFAWFAFQKVNARGSNGKQFPGS
jgi:SAM-dependent methyltransferase